MNGGLGTGGRYIGGLYTPLGGIIPRGKITGGGLIGAGIHKSSGYKYIIL